MKKAPTLELTSAFLEYLTMGGKTPILAYKGFNLFFDAKRFLESEPEGDTFDPEALSQSLMDRFGWTIN